MVAELVVIGGGKMGEALVAGMLAAGRTRPEDVVVVEASEARRRELSSDGGLAARYPGLQVTSALPDQAKHALVAVKPPDVEGVCRALNGKGTQRALSIAAGVTLAQLDQWCPPESAVVRAMPNMGALAQAGATAIAAGSRAKAADVEWANGIMAAVGLVVEVPEHLLDAVTGVSGSGPAYLMLVAEAMIEGGVLMGLPRPVATSLVAQTMAGAGALLAATGQSPEQLRAAVTSPGGTTAAALRRLEAAGARSAFIEAVAASAERSRELGREGH